MSLYLLPDWLIPDLYPRSLIGGFIYTPFNSPYFLFPHILSQSECGVNLNLSSDWLKGCPVLLSPDWPVIVYHRDPPANHRPSRKNLLLGGQQNTADGGS